jgi:hypothetical protein
MIQISKAQSEYLRTHGVKEGITRTMAQKSRRHNYYAAEECYILALLDEYAQSQKVVEVYGKV